MANEVENPPDNSDVLENVQPNDESEETETMDELKNRILALEQLVEVQQAHINALEIFTSHCVCQENPPTVFLVVNDLEDSSFNDTQSILKYLRGDKVQSAEHTKVDDPEPIEGIHEDESLEQEILGKEVTLNSVIDDGEEFEPEILDREANHNSVEQPDEIFEVTTLSDSDLDSDSESGSDSDKDSGEATTITATTDGERSLSDFDDEEEFEVNDDESPSPNLGDQVCQNIADLQDELDFQELTLARNSFHSNRTEVLPIAELTTKDKCELVQFNREIEPVLTNEVSCASSAFFSNENEIPGFGNLDEVSAGSDSQEVNNMSNLPVPSESSSSLVSPYSIIPDINISAPLSEMSVRVGNEGDEVQFGKQHKIQRKFQGAHEFSCPVCEKPLQNKREVDAHILGHNAIPSFPCRTCVETFRTRACLTVHEEIHKEVSAVRSVRRKRKFKRRGPRIDSVQNNSHEIVQGSSTDDEVIVLDSITSKTPTIYQDEIICEFTFCGKRLGASSDCYMCSKRFCSHRNFKAHQLMHAGDRPFYCNICTVRFRDLPALYEHIGEEHEDLKKSANTFKCSTCSKYSPVYANTVRTSIIGGKEKRPIKTIFFTCQFKFCGNPSNEPQQLDYECFQCDKTCETIESLCKHEELHSGDTPFPCNICCKCFGTITKLKDHVYEKHKDPTPNWKMFSCRMTNHHMGSPSKKILRTYGAKVPSKDYNLQPINLPPFPDLTKTTQPTSDSIFNVNNSSATVTAPIIRLDEIMDIVGITSEMGDDDDDNENDDDACKSKDCGIAGMPENHIHKESSLALEPPTPIILIPPSESLKCPNCSLQLDTHRSLLRHFKTHETNWANIKLQNPVKCPFCDRSYKFLRGLWKHVNEVHEGCEIFACNLCYTVFESQPSLVDHIKTIHENISSN